MTIKRNDSSLCARAYISNTYLPNIYIYIYKCIRIHVHIHTCLLDVYPHVLHCTNPFLPPPPKRRPFDWFYSRTALPPTFCDTPKKFSFFVFLLSLFFSRRIEAAEVAGHEIPFFSAEYSCTIPLSSLGQT